jgi:hypothetical protein
LGIRLNTGRGGPEYYIWLWQRDAAFQNKRGTILMVEDEGSSPTVHGKGASDVAIFPCCTCFSPLRFLLATELGAIPATFVYVYIGTLMGSLARMGPDLKQHRPLEWIFQGFGLVVVIGVTFYVTRLVNRALKKRFDS